MNTQAEGSLKSSTRTDNLYIAEYDSYYGHFIPADKNELHPYVKISKFDKTHDSESLKGIKNLSMFEENSMFQSPVIHKTSTNKFINIMKEKSSSRLPLTLENGEIIKPIEFADLSDFKDYNYEEEKVEQEIIQDKVYQLKMDREEFETFSPQKYPSSTPKKLPKLPFKPKPKWERFTPDKYTPETELEHELFKFRNSRKKELQRKIKEFELTQSAKYLASLKKKVSFKDIPRRKDDEVRNLDEVFS